MQWFNKTTALITLLVISVISVWLGYGLRHSSFDYDFEKFFPPHDDETSFYESYRKNFENDYDFLFIAVGSKQGIFNTPFLSKLQLLTDTLSHLPNVKEVHSITNLTLPVFAGGGMIKKPYVHLKNDSLLLVDSVRIYETGELKGSFLADDGKTTCIFLQTKDRMAKKPSDVLIAQIENTVKSFGFDEVHMAGKIKAQQVYLQRMQQEIVLFLGIAIALVIIFLVITFRSFYNTVVPLAVVLLSIIWQIGIMYYTGKKIDILTMLVPTILFIVGMSDVIHIISKYIEELRLGLGKREAIVKTIKDVGMATFLTSFTTALGFFTLITSNISPIREFGLYTAIGVMVAYTLAITVLPSVLLLIPTPSIALKQQNTRGWDKILHRQLRFIIRSPKRILWGAGLLTAIFSLGIIPLKVNNRLLEDLSPKEPLRAEFDYFENQYSGGRPFEMQWKLITPGKHFMDPEVMQEMVTLQEHAQTHFQLGFVRSPVTLVKMFHRSLNSGLNSYYRLPQNKDETERLKKAVDLYGIMGNKEVQKIISGNGTVFRMSGKMHDLGSYTVNRMEKEFIKTLPPLQHIQYRLTGSARLIDKNISYLSVNLMQGLGIAVLIVAIGFGLIYRSFKTMVIALIPNLIPMICIAGLMGFTGIDIKISTSIIFTIAFGIAVDDTIHFLSRYKIERKKGKSNLYAIKRSFLSTGKAMILTSVILCAGFITMISSSFMSIFYIGLLLSVTLFIALLADLYVLPVLLMGRKKKRHN